MVCFLFFSLLAFFLESNVPPFNLMFCFVLHWDVLNQNWFCMLYYVSLQCLYWPLLKSFWNTRLIIILSFLLCFCCQPCEKLCFVLVTACFNFCKISIESIPNFIFHFWVLLVNRKIIMYKFIVYFHSSFLFSWRVVMEVSL